MSVSDSASRDAELTPAFSILAPRIQGAAAVFCSPHSGRIYPASFLAASRLDPHTLRKSEDCYVDELFAGVRDLGVPLIAARFPRAYLDVNREPYELDPELFSEPMPPYANTQSVRVVGGLGTIARIVADGEEIYRDRMSLTEALTRIDRLYKPFHSALSGLLSTTWRQFGMAVLIDCQSMPSASIGQPHAARPDFVLGDRFGASCDSKLTRFLREVLVGLGYEVQLNRPYAGGYITEHYGRPHRGLHALQVEVNRSLYLDESRLARSLGFGGVKRDLMAAASRLLPELPNLTVRRAAAE
jgi:N-formylglutamate amidohydrolase